MIIAIDFDGTLHLGQFPQIGIPAPDAVKVMKQLKNDGHYLIINTARSGDDLLNAINWLLERGIPFDRVNDNEPTNVEKYGNNSRKIYAHLYIDDRQVGGLPPWLRIYQEACRMQDEYIAKTTKKTCENLDV